MTRFWPVALAATALVAAGAARAQMAEPQPPSTNAAASPQTKPSTPSRHPQRRIAAFATFAAVPDSAGVAARFERVATVMPPPKPESLGGAPETGSAPSPVRSLFGALDPSPAPSMPAEPSANPLQTWLGTLVPRPEGERLPAVATRGQIDALIAHHARLNGVPEALVHRVVVRESKYNPRAVGRGGAMGLMQIKTATARGVGYPGGSAGLLDAETNLTYGVKYLAGAWRVSGGSHDRAVSHYARGYYYAAKRKGRGRDAEPTIAQAPEKAPSFFSLFAKAEPDR